MIKTLRNLGVEFLQADKELISLLMVRDWMLSPYDQDKAITSNHITSFQHCIRRLSQGNKTRKRSKSTHVRKEKRESLFEDDIIDYTQNPNRMYQKDTRRVVGIE